MIEGRGKSGECCQLDEQWFNLHKDILKDALYITPTNDNNPYVAPPSSDTTIEYVNTLGYPNTLRNVSAKSVNALYQPWRAILSMINMCLIEFVQSIQTFLTDRKNLTTATRGKKKTTHLLIPIVRFVGKDGREIFGLPIPDALLTDEIKGAPCYGEYQEHVAKYQQYLDAEHGKVDEGGATESSKSTKVTKPKAAKAIKPAGDKAPKLTFTQPPKPKPAPTQPFKAVPEKKRKLGPARPVVIREPDSGRIQPLLDVQGKGKEKVIDKQAAHDLLTLLTLKHKSSVDQFQSMVSVLIHQDTSSVPLITTPVIDLTTSQSGSPLPTSTATTSIITTTTSLPPPPQQSTADLILVKHIGELEQHMANLLQYNLALEERLGKHGSRLYKLKNLNIPHHVSKAVDEIVTDAVNWGMQAPLRARFSDLPAIDMKEILQQRMFEDKLYEAHEDHKNLYDALQKSLKRDYSNQLLSDLEEARQKKKRDVTYQELLLGLHRYSHHLHLLQQAQLVLEVHFSDDEDSWNDHQLKANLRKDWWEPLPEEERPAILEPSWTIPSSNVCHSPSVPDGGVSQDTHKLDLEYLRYGSKGSSPALSISKMKATSYPNFGLELLVPEQMWIDDVYKILCRIEKKSDHTCGFLVLSKLKPTQDTGHLDHLSGSDKRMLSIAIKLWTRNLVIRQRVKDFQLGIKSYQTQLNLTKPGWDATGYEFKHDYTIIESPRAVVFLVNNNKLKIMWFNEIYKFGDGTLIRIMKALAYKVKEFKIK
uniref:Uncharacterized protein n=1 Tax=Tanacetum cinerariifolium TaxID=118510 RepID=A0A6L2KBD1_TANCI|nr:hypothetical protein [Tanacetum cinerariifolium]